MTVLPISSKEKKFSVKIDEVIQSKSNPFLISILAKLDFDYFSICHYILTEITPFDLGESEDIYKELFEEYKDYYNPEKAKKMYNDGTGMEVLSASLKKLKNLFKHYEKFNKVSYAKCDQIRTISKDRIIYLNDLDPCGKIRVSNETLDRIDTKLKDLYLKD